MEAITHFHSPIIPPPQELSRPPERTFRPNYAPDTMLGAHAFPSLSLVSDKPQSWGFLTRIFAGKKGITEGDFRADDSPSVSPTNENVAWKEGAFDGNGVKIYYYRSQPAAEEASTKPKPIGVPRSLTTPKKPILVFLHGLGAAGPVLENLMADLATHFDIVLPTARGHGLSQPIPAGSFTIDNLVSDAVEVIKQVSPNKPVYLGGHSMGASTAARVAKQHPELVKALVLEDPPWLRFAGGSFEKKDDSDMPLPLKMARSLQSAPENSGDSSFMSMKQAQRSLDVDGLLPTFSETDNCINEVVQGIEVPVMLQLGDTSKGAVLKHELAEKVVSDWPKVKIVKFDDAGHVIHSGSNRELWISSVKDFLTSV